MNRRRFLTTAGLGVSILAGCAGRMSSGNEFPTLEVEQRTTTTEQGLKFAVRGVAGYSTSSPAEVEMAVTNVTDSDVDVIFGGSPPYSRYWGHRTDGPETLVLIPETRDYVVPETGDSRDFVPTESDDGCWQANTGIVGQDIALERTLKPGESISETYAVVSQPGEKCLVPGTYRFDSLEHATEFDVVLK